MFPRRWVVHCSRRSRKAEVPRIIVDPSPVTGSPRHEHVKPTMLSPLTRHAPTICVPIGSLPDFVDDVGFSDLNVIASKHRPTELLGLANCGDPGCLTSEEILRHI